MYSKEQIINGTREYVEDYFRWYEFDWESGGLPNSCYEKVELEFELGEMEIRGKFLVYGYMQLDKGDYSVPSSTRGKITIECEELECYEMGSDVPIYMDDRCWLEQIKTSINI